MGDGEGGVQCSGLLDANELGFVCSLGDEE